MSTIDRSVDGIEKDYSITLINIDTRNDKHTQTFERIQNSFPEWCAIVFNSSDKAINCCLPIQDFSLKEIVPGITSDDKKSFSIIKHDTKIPPNHVAANYLEETELYFVLESAELTFV